jgi:uncharacterized glyoxalase superfamily protein PhnB
MKPAFLSLRVRDPDATMERAFEGDPAMVQPTPPGFHSVTPSLTLKDCQKAIEFYKKAFNAKVLDQSPNPVGKGIMHAVIEIGNSLIMMGDEAPGMSARSAETLGASPISLFLYVPNVDEAFKQAVDAGAVPLMPVADMFWGDRAGNVKDPFGYSWMIATHTQDLSKDQIKKGAEAFFAQFAKK